MFVCIIGGKFFLKIFNKLLVYIDYWYFGYVKDVIKNWYLLFRF